MAKKLLKKQKLSVSKKKLSPAIKKKITKPQKAKVLPIPKGYHSVTPYLILKDASDAIAFYKKAFGAKEKIRVAKPNGKIGHAELKIGDTEIMIADECPEMKMRSPASFGGSPVIIHLYIKKVDEVIQRAISTGAKLVQPAQDMFYGDRSGILEDPFGHIWCVSTHIENVSPAKIKKRAAEFYSK